MSTAATRSELERLLGEDAPYGDLTTDALGIAGVPARMVFTARGAMVAALVEDAAALVELAGGRVDGHVRSGVLVEPGALLLSASGPAASLLRSWKVAQTLIETWSGVASAARAMVDAASCVSPAPVIACTRKNPPGTKAFAVAAVRAGGALMHRLGLSETILVFPEHLSFLDGPLSDQVEALRRKAPEKKLAVEVASVDAGVEAARAGFHVVQTEKFSPGMVGELVRALAEREARPLVAAAGGIGPGNAADYARAGADILVTSAPYGASPRDVKVLIERA
ncbi:MAG: ModD protein [Alphaproteobacteria bacterium]|nr:ModD protein [Alphaproteobacteria bacterium]